MGSRVRTHWTFEQSSESERSFILFILLLNIQLWSYKIDLQIHAAEIMKIILLIANLFLIYPTYLYIYFIRLTRFSR